MERNIGKLSLFMALVASLILCIFGAGCGDGNDDDNESDGGSNVVELSADTNPVAVGGASIISVNFSFSSDDVFDDDQNVALVVFVPNALLYREGTAEIDRPVGDDRGVGPQVFPCASGGAFLLFDLDEDDLIEAENPSGNADAKLKFTVDAVSASASAVIQATARNNSVGFSCDTGLLPDAVTAIVVQ